jgi:hypothetical protein
MEWCMSWCLMVCEAPIFFIHQDKLMELPHHTFLLPVLVGVMMIKTICPHPSHHQCCMPLILLTVNLLLSPLVEPVRATLLIWGANSTQDLAKGNPK